MSPNPAYASAESTQRVGYALNSEQVADFRACLPGCFSNGMCAGQAIGAVKSLGLPVPHHTSGFVPNPHELAFHTARIGADAQTDQPVYVSP